MKNVIIYIQNDLFTKFNKLSAKALETYFTIKVLEHQEEAITKKSISKFLSKTERAVYDAIKECLKAKIIYNEKLTNSKSKHFKTQKLFSKNEVYLKLKTSKLICYIKDLEAQELRVYMFMLAKAFESTSFLSQEKLADGMGTHLTTARRITRKLESKNYVKITRVALVLPAYCLNYILKM